MILPSFRRVAGIGDADGFIRRLHEEGLVHRVEDGPWIVCGFEEVQEVLRDPGRFSSSVMEEGYPLLTDDPPDHDALRAVVQEAFVPSAVADLRPMVEQIAAELAAGVEPGEEVDAVDAVAAPLPAAVIAHLLGVPEGRRGRFRELADELTGQLDPVEGRSRDDALRDLKGSLREALEERRARPRDDLMTTLAERQAEESELSEDTALDLAKVILIAGYETTTGLIGCLLHRLAREPGVWRRVRSDPESIDRVVEEVVRLDSPVRFAPRRATTDLELAGREVRRGDRVIAFLAAANRDPERWDDPATFDVDRPHQRHLGFGHGIHFCLGAPLARLEAAAALEALALRFESVSPGETPAERRPPGIVSGFRELPLVFR